ncbi:PepSY-associated TM helix domain-containing protein [uncultured Sphingomonas sp.]|uniref:PepSY-associated TM helix domain-containing protein n=1 Tax=uncultured Sphingomonas sp. TaxID=158754 RepID=UPI0035C9E4EE
MTKIILRNTWFQVHKWIGLILAILIIPLSVTGAALVWDEALDHVLNPQRYATSGAATIDPTRYVAAAKIVLAPGERITSMTFPEAAGAPVTVTAGKPGAAGRGGPPPRTTVWLDPPTARVLDHGNSGTGLIRTMHMIHGSLMVPGVGRQVVGWIGVAMLISSLSGLWLWWPTVGRWVRGLRWRRHRNTDTNLHHLFGFWIAVPLFVLSLTGMWISFPQVFGGGGNGAPRGPRPVPLATPAITVDAAIISARAALPGTIVRIDWPTDQKREWTIAYAGTQTNVRVDDEIAKASVAPSERETLARIMRRIHDGTRMGIVWQAIIFLGGILPAILAITGIIMWWRARGWRAQLKARLAA